MTFLYEFEVRGRRFGSDIEAPSWEMAEKIVKELGGIFVGRKVAELPDDGVAEIILRTGKRLIRRAA